MQTNGGNDHGCNEGVTQSNNGKIATGTILMYLLGGMVVRVIMPVMMGVITK